jgi:hypothetical protein
MKPAIYYTLISGEFRAKPFEVLCVTSESDNLRVYGRTIDGERTHAMRHSCKGRFSTLQTAIKAATEVAAIHAKFASLTREAKHHLTNLALNERKEIEAYLKGANDVSKI